MDRFLGQKTVFIGGGRMGEAIFSGLLSNGILKADDLTVLDVYAPRREELAEKYGLHAWDNTPENLQKVYSMDVYGWMNDLYALWQEPVETLRRPG